MTEESKTIQNRRRKEYRRLHPNGRVPGFLDEADRIIIKEYCKHTADPPLKAMVDLEHNQCSLFCLIQNEYKLMASVQKVIYFNTFVLLNEFRIFVTRNPQPGTLPATLLLPAGTALIVSPDDPQFFHISHQGQFLSVPRHVLVKKATIRQLYSLYLTNPEAGYGAGEGQFKIDLVRLYNSYYSTSNHSSHALSCH